MTQVTQMQGKTLKSSSASSTYSSGYSSPKQWSCYGDPLAPGFPVGAIAIAPNWWWIGFWYIPQFNMIPMKNSTIRLIQTPLRAHGFPIIHSSPSRSLSITFNYHIPILIILLMVQTSINNFFILHSWGATKTELSYRVAEEGRVIGRRLPGAVLGGATVEVHPP